MDICTGEVRPPSIKIPSIEILKKTSGNPFMNNGLYQKYPKMPNIFLIEENQCHGVAYIGRNRVQEDTLHRKMFYSHTEQYVTPICATSVSM